MSKKCNRKWVKTQDVSTSKVFVSLADEDLWCWNISVFYPIPVAFFALLIDFRYLWRNNEPLQDHIYVYYMYIWEVEACMHMHY